jgi:uncharacterized delta-60 repeat protein
VQREAILAESKDDVKVALSVPGAAVHDRVLTKEAEVTQDVPELGVVMTRLVLIGLGALLGFSPVGLSAAVVTEQWVARYNGPGNSDDYAKAMAVDEWGNVYVTGYSYGAGSHYDYATAKYDPAGSLLWVARYDGPGGYHDQAVAMAVDTEGSVYVAGHSYGGGATSDYTTVKYNSDGVEQWVARYNGPGNGNDLIFAIALDASGHVYVTGESEGGDFRRDYTTIKYDPAGRQLWVARYNGPGNYHDSARAIAVDASGSVYVTGYSYSDGFAREDYATVKYDSAGRQLWVARYAGPSGPPNSAYDVAEAIAVDASGHVCVTGYSDGAGTSYDYATIKYDSQGAEQWVARYNGSGNNYDYARAIALDHSGNVYVTGYSQNVWTGQDYATVKYGPAGNELWAAVFNGPGYRNDRARDIKADGRGHVYVTGYTYSYGSQYDCATVKYDAAGNELWAATYDGPAERLGGGLPAPGDDPDNDCDYAYAVALDGRGNVYVTGGSFGNGSRYDYATVKYSQEDTPAGDGVEVSDAAAGATVTFETVLAGGNTAIFRTPHGPLPPAGTKLLPTGTLYEMTTTAVVSGTIEIAIRYDDAALTASQENALKLWYYEDASSKWIDVTAYTDRANNVIVGVSHRLSFFAVTAAP